MPKSTEPLNNEGNSEKISPVRTALGCLITEVMDDPNTESWVVLAAEATVSDR
jgi:hypothetical protein